MNSIRFHFFLIMAICSVIQNNSNTKTFITPDNTVFLWDWHDTCSTKDLKGIAQKSKQFFQNSSRKAALTFYTAPIITYAIYLKYGSKIGIAKKPNTADGFIAQLIQPFSVLHGKEEELLNIANTDKLFPQIVSLIKELKEKTFEMYLGSNIGERSLNLVKQKFPDFFAYFNDTFIPYTDSNNQFIAKPNPAFFIHVANELKKRKPHLQIIVFVDDRIDFIEGALKANAYLDGITFKTIQATSADQTVTAINTLLKVDSDITKPAHYSSEDKQALWRNPTFNFNKNAFEAWINQIDFWANLEQFFRDIKNFVFGTATSAQQIEGTQTHPDYKKGTESAGFVDNNWTTHPKYAAAYSKNRGPRHWDMVEQDTELMKYSGINSYRLSIAWEKIQPDNPNEFDLQALEHYKNEIRLLKQNNIQPRICLFHFTMPVWFDKLGGFAKEENIHYFIAFGEYIMKAFSQDDVQVTYWAAFNELTAYTLSTYLLEEMPYYKKEETGWFSSIKNIFHHAMRLKTTKIATLNMMKAHIALYDKAKEINKENQFGFIHHFVPIDPFDPTNTASRKAAEYANIITNECVLQVFEKGQFPWILQTIDMPEGKNKLDWIGVNYYGSQYIDLRLQSIFNNQVIRGSKTTEPINSRQGIFPEGLYRAIVKASILNVPIYITELGINLQDPTIFDAWIKKHLYVIKKAYEDGFDLRGLDIWTFYTTLGWKEHTQKYSRDYGLFTVPFRNTTLEFNDRYQRIIKTPVQPFRDFLIKVLKSLSV